MNINLTHLFLLLAVIAQFEFCYGLFGSRRRAARRDRNERIQFLKGCKQAAHDMAFMEYQEDNPTATNQRNITEEEEEPRRRFKTLRHIGRVLRVLAFPLVPFNEPMRMIVERR